MKTFKPPRTRRYAKEKPEPTELIQNWQIQAGLDMEIQFRDVFQGFLYQSVAARLQRNHER